ncbi:hypothetical protein ALIPUT_00723 [Alistipes putredinis DSM 17216]|uniref:Uncharacterized protein n=1 Tax=Alistipes putredinis DSM 17216 TaxID=445970 RepID=B0MUL6_9BACT|nr:hypothetical protein ALIPUT_00723 [Alistipes putredinis DSM 17216]
MYFLMVIRSGTMNMKQMYLSSAPDISEFWRKDRKNGSEYLTFPFILYFCFSENSKCKIR